MPAALPIAVPDADLVVDDLPVAQRPLRISVVTETYPPEINGVAMSIHRIVEGLRGRGHELQLLRPRQQRDGAAGAGKGFQEVLMRGLAIPRYPDLRMGLPAKRALLALWRSRRPDVVHIATEGPLGWSALQAARVLRLPVTSDFRTNFHAYSRHYGIGWGLALAALAALAVLAGGRLGIDTLAWSAAPSAAFATGRRLRATALTAGAATTGLAGSAGGWAAAGVAGVLAGRVPGLHVGAGCLLAPGRVVQELPYDPRLYFHGEEQAFALRAWTRGWDIFHIPRMPVYHQYHAGGQAPRPLHWSPDLDSQRAQRSAELTALANDRLAALLWRGEDLGLYSLGRERSLADYADFSGIDYAARRIAPSARKARFGL